MQGQHGEYVSSTQEVADADHDMLSTTATTVRTSHFLVPVQFCFTTTFTTHPHLATEITLTITFTVTIVAKPCLPAPTIISISGTFCASETVTVGASFPVSPIIIIPASITNILLAASGAQSMAVVSTLADTNLTQFPIWSAWALEAVFS